MHTPINIHSRIPLLMFTVVGAFMLMFSALCPFPVIARSVAQELSTGRQSPHVFLAQLCVRRLGDYISHDHAIRVRNAIRSRGFQAWIEYHGSIISGSRTYVVFAEVPC